MKAAIYCRISKDERGQALGVKRQEAECLALCDRLGWDADMVLTDNDLASKAGVRRPAYEELVVAVRNRSVAAIAVYHPDRLTRRPTELEELIDLIDEAGVKVATVTAGDYDLSTASGRMVARMLGAAARHEVERMGERMRSKKTELAAAGRPLGGGRRSYGYTRDGLSLVAEEADVLRDTARSLLGGETLRRAVDRLNDAGTVPDSGSWSIPSLRSALTSHRAAGLSVHHGEVVGEAVWPAVLDQATWLAVRALRRHRPGPTATYLLTGVVFCRCGVAMYCHPQSKARGPMYQCSLMRGGCGGCGIRADKLEPYVIAEVSAGLARLVKGAAAALSPTVDLDEVQAQIDRDEAALADWTRRKVEGAADVVEYDTAVPLLRARLVKLRGDYGRISASVGGSLTLAEARAEWSADVPARNRMLRRLVVVVVHPCGRGRRTPADERVDVLPWGSIHH